MIRAAALALALATPAQAAEFNFCWIGDSGYTMTGRMTVDDTAMSNQLVTETDVTRFKIAGYLDGQLQGTWSAADRTDTTSWQLMFDPAAGRFLMPGETGLGITQAWNADGSASDCGTPGFGFNAGSNAQDLCINSVWVVQSGIAPNTPFFVTSAPVTPLCDSPALMGKRRR